MNTHPYRLAWQPPKSPQIPFEFDTARFWGIISFAALTSHLLCASFWVSSLILKESGLELGTFVSQEVIQLGYIFWVGFAYLAIFCSDQARFCQTKRNLLHP